MNQMVKEEETLVGVVGADDNLSEEAAPDPGFLGRLRQFFTRFRRDDEADGEAASGSALVEHLVDQSDEVAVVIAETPESEVDDESKTGPIARIFNFFKRDKS
jgi:hypothetical protein